MLHLAGIGGDEYVPVKKISQTLNISFHFLTKIFQQLARAGLISSYRGPNGGVRLEIDASKITVKAVVVARWARFVHPMCARVTRMHGGSALSVA